MRFIKLSKSRFCENHYAKTLIIKILELKNGVLIRVNSLIPNSNSFLFKNFIATFDYNLKSRI